MAQVELHEAVRWAAAWKVEKFDSAGRLFAARLVEGNALMYVGASALFEQLIGTGAITAFNTANAYLGVGDSSAGAVATQTNLQAATNKVRVVSDAGWPKHTHGSGSGNASCEWKSTFTAAVANFAWNEAALFNAGAGGQMLNRKVLSGLGTKLNGQVWTLTLTVTLG